MKTVTMMSGPAIRKLKDENARLREAKGRLRRLVRAGENLGGMFEFSSGLVDAWGKEIRAFELALSAASEIAPSTTHSGDSTEFSGN
jgi:hypothetical protein